MFTLLFTAGKLTFAPAASWPLVVGAAVLLALLSVYFYGRARGDFTPRKRRLLIALRVLAFACLALALLQPSITIKSRVSGRPKVLVLVDGSASMALPYLPGAGGDSTRSRASVAAEFSRALLERLPRRFEKELFVFSDTLAEADPERLVSAAQQPGLDAGTGARAAPAGTARREPRAGSPRSGLGSALAEASRRIGNAPGAVVLVSDGAASYGPDPTAVARTLSFPVYTVAAAEEGRFRDVEASEVLSPSSGFVGSEIPVLARVKGHGLENLEVPVTISEVVSPLSRLPVSRGKVRLAGSAYSEVLLSVRPSTAGVHFYELSVPAVDGEISALNNTKRFAVEAVSEKLKVSFLEGDLTWDFTFLKRALESDPRLETTVSLVSGWKAGSPNVRNVSAGAPGGPAGAAVVIVSDGASGHLGSGLWRSIADFVSSGGGLLFAGVDGLAQAPAAARELLPVTLKPFQEWGPQRMLDVTLTAQGADHPICQVENDPALNRESWKDVSPLIGVAAVDRAKPGASVLLEARSDGETWPLLVAGTLGRGRVLFAGAGGLWRWDFALPGVGGSKRLYPGLVSNAISWLSEAGAQRRFAALPAKWVFESGDDVRFLVRGVDDTSAVRVEVRDASGRQAMPPGTKGAAGGRVGPAAGRAPEFGALKPGAYSYTASSSQAGRPLSFRGSFMVDKTGAEDRSLFPDPGLLSYVSQASGGESFRAADAQTGRVDEGQVDKLAREIGAFGEKVLVERQLRLWNHPVLLILFASLLGLEWWLRRRSGLP
jgi:hypothetical protein